LHQIFVKPKIERLRTSSHRLLAKRQQQAFRRIGKFKKITQFLNMLQKYTLLIVLFSFLGFGQTKNSTKTYVSRKGLYEIAYNTEHWQKSDETSIWDAEFYDTYNLLKIYFSEFDYFVENKKLKKTITEQYKSLGKIKNLKIYQKKINEMEVNYFMCTLDYHDSTYIFQGFFYNGKGGTVEVQFGAQQEAVNQNQELIEEFCNGIKKVK
jgi:hypothetical protein